MNDCETVVFTFTGCTEDEAVKRAMDSFHYSVTRVSSNPVNVVSVVARPVGNLAYEVEVVYSFG